MTEVDWLACTDPYPMLDHLTDRASDRKLMLFSVACLRRIWHLLTDLRSRGLVEAAERLADDWAGEEARRAFDTAYGAFQAANEGDQLQDTAGDHTHEAVECVAGCGAGNAMTVASKSAEAVGYVAAFSVPVADPNDWSPARTGSWERAERVERAAQAALVHDIIGNPFRSLSTATAWRTPQVVSLARAIYRGRTFEQMPELAAALEETGCADAALLDHCRRPDGHVRGCWVVDWLLGNDEGMTEAEWLACTDPQQMWWVLRPKPDRRKQQLYAAACCRRIWHLLTEERCRQALQVLERLADGQAMEDEWNDARRAVSERAWDAVSREIIDKAAAAVEAADCCHGPTVPAGYAAKASGRPHEPAVQASLLRDVIGNPLRPIIFDRSWRTPQVLELAQSIYEGRAFDRLPALGEALDRAGCQDPEILGHCREAGPHVRGCWVMDLIANTRSLLVGPRADVLTADEWDACTDADKMLYAIGLTASKRKLRLLACACCRQVWDCMTEERSQRGVETAERFADGLATKQELAMAREGTGAAWNAVMGPAWAFYAAARAAHFACLDDEQQFLRARHETRTVVLWSVVLDAESQAVEAEKSARYLNREGPLYYAPQREEAVAAEMATQASLLRDIFGNPFRPPQVLNPVWLRPPVLALAQAIYDQRAFERMPELAVALKQAGCDAADMLAHCRSPGVHVRGCWVVDLLLGKE